jgi:alcohol dehydrogenase class IV
MSLYRFSFPTPIHFGNGSRAEAGPHLWQAGARRPLIVTDRGIARLPILAEVVSLVERSGLHAAAFSEISGNPTRSQVREGADTFRAHGADSIVGLGGGAALDVAKAIALMAHHPGDLFDYEDEKPGAFPIDREIPYWIAIPTTAGTGSEVGRSSVISDDRTHVKKVIFSPRLLARAVFADPELTVGLPSRVTAATGMDALTHCVEAYLAKGYHPICDGIALEGVRLIASSLEQAAREPGDLEARGAMLMASLMGAVAFQKGLGLTHSCAHALSTVADLHHGLANGIMIDHALRFNVPAVPDRFRILAQAAQTRNDRAEDFIDWLSRLKIKLEIPGGLTEAGVTPEAIDRLSALAHADGCHLNNPRPCSREDFRRIYQEALR